MKIFGWSKRKASQAETVQQNVKKTDPWNKRHGQDRGTYTPPCKSSCNIRKQQGLFGVNDDAYLRGAKSATGEPTSHSVDEELHDKIRVMFSLEQAGLLAIGTFAVDQSSAVVDTRNHPRPAGDGFGSRTDLLQSFDDEDHLPRIAGSSCERASELSSDFDSSDAESEVGNQAVKPVSTALTLRKGSRFPVTGTKPIVLLTSLPAELRRSLEPASPWLHRNSPPHVPLGHWTDSVAPPVVLPESTAKEEYYSSYFCGLFSSNRRSSRPEKVKWGRDQRQSSQSARRTQEDHRNFFTLYMKFTKKSVMNSGTNGVPSLQKLAKLWKSSCLQSSARIAPDRKARSPRKSQALKQGAASSAIPSGEVLITPAPLPLGGCDKRRQPPRRCCSEGWCPNVAEFRRRVAMRERRDHSDQDDGGHWIKSDAEYVVLEM